ncbi:IucA/IucC family protein, partial [Streptomyces swartbergensis]
MERVDLMPPPDGDDSAQGASSPGDSAQDDPVSGVLAERADAYAAVPLLNCLLREVAERVEPGVYRLRTSGRLLRVRGRRRPTGPEVHADGAWHRLTHAELVKLTAEELRRRTGLSNSELPAEMIDSRDAVAALLAARARATPPDDPYLRSEQCLLTGHTHHPAPKARGGGPAAGWLPYAPEAYARFPLALLGLREDTVVEEGDTSALDAL